MESHKTSAFVFRSFPFKDFDKRVVLLTRQFGKVIAIAPGAQKSQKRFGSGLESLTLVSALYQMKANSSLGQLQEVQILNPFSVLKKNVKKMAYGSYFLEVIGEVMGENEPSHPLFDFLRSFLEALEKSHQEEVLARFFEARLLPKIGYQPVLKHCVKCLLPLEAFEGNISFSLSLGGIVCFQCLEREDQSSHRVSKEVISYFNHMMMPQKSSPISGAMLQEIKTFLPSFLFYQLGKELKSYAFIEQVVGDESLANNPLNSF